MLRAKITITIVSIKASVGYLESETLSMHEDEAAVRRNMVSILELAGHLRLYLILWYVTLTKGIKGVLKAHIYISLYESNTLQEQDAALLFLSMIP